MSDSDVYRRQNLMSIDVRFWRLNSIPGLKKIQIYNGRRPITYRYSNEAERIQMKRKELTKTFMMISDRKKHFGPHRLNINT